MPAPTLVISPLAFEKAARKIQNECIAGMRKRGHQVINAVTVKIGSERIGRSCASLRQAVRRRVVLQAQIGPGFEIIGERRIQQSVPATQAQTPAVRTVVRIVPVPGLHDVKIEADCDAGMGIEILERQRDGLIHSNEMLWVIRWRRYHRRTTKFTQESLLVIRRVGVRQDTRNLWNH